MDTLISLATDNVSIVHNHWEVQRFIHIIYNSKCLFKQRFSKCKGKISDRFKKSMARIL